MTRLEQLSRELMDVVVNLGYPAELGELMAQNLGTETQMSPSVIFMVLLFITPSALPRIMKFISVHLCQ